MGEEKIEEILGEILLTLKENSKIQKELLNFFIAIEERETGASSVNSMQYLKELERDGFNPPTG